jgi:hypothetical protein
MTSYGIRENPHANTFGGDVQYFNVSVAKNYLPNYYRFDGKCRARNWYCRVSVAKIPTSA